MKTTFTSNLAKILDVYTNSSYDPIEETFTDPDPGYASTFYQYFRRRFFSFLHQGGLVTPPTILPESKQREHTPYYTRLMAVLDHKCIISEELTHLLTVTHPSNKESDVVLRAIPCGFFFRDEPTRLIESAMDLTALTHPQRKDLAMDAIAAACITAGLYQGTITEAAMMPLAVIDFLRHRDRIPFSEEEIDAYLVPWEKYARIQLHRGKRYQLKDSMINPTARWKRLMKKYIDTPFCILGDGGLDLLITAIDAILIADDRFTPFFNNTVLVFGNNRTITLLASMWYEILYPHTPIPEKWRHYG